jgi:hypothetical protein
MASVSRGASRASGTSTMIHLSPLMAHVRSKQETGHDDMTRNSSTESAVAPVSKSKLARNIARVASRKVRIHHTYATCLVGFRRRTLSEQAMVSHATPCNKRDNHVCGNSWSPATSTHVAAVRKASATRPDSTAVTLYRMEPTSKALRSSERDKAPGKILGKHATHRKNATRSSICVKLTMAWRRQVVGAAAAPCASQGEPAPADGARSPPQNHAHGSAQIQFCTATPKPRVRARRSCKECANVVESEREREREGGGALTNPMHRSHGSPACADAGAVLGAGRREEKNGPPSCGPRVSHCALRRVQGVVPGS